MKRAIAGATGFIGKALVKRWLNQGCEIAVIGRSAGRIKAAFQDKVQAMTWTELRAGQLDPRGLECLVNLAGAGIADRRWTAQRKQEILDSRIDATRAMVAYGLKNKIPLLNASAIGIYGRQAPATNSLPPAWDEDSPSPSYQVQGFLPLVCRRWEDATTPLSAEGVRTVNLRTGVVLGEGGGALSKMAAPFHSFVGGPIGSGEQAVSWISLNDVCRAIDFLIDRKEVRGPVNLVAPHCIRQRDLAKSLGRALNRPGFLPVPGVLLRIFFGQLADEMLLSGQHVYPRRLLEQGFVFKHHTVEQLLREVYGS